MYDHRLPGRCAGVLLDIVNYVFPESNSWEVHFEVFEKTCWLYRLYTAISDEDVSENLKVAVVHKNLQDAELQKHSLR